MKKCSSCKVGKPLGQFSKKAGGLQPKCKTCVAAYNKMYRAKNKERIAEGQRDNYLRNRDQALEEATERYWANRDALLAQKRKYYRLNKGAISQRVRERKQHVSGRATPPWSKKDLIEAYYMIARGMTEQTGIPHVVDHIVPLKGEDVCGLHVENNLQVLASTANDRKGNRMENGNGE